MMLVKHDGWLWFAENELVGSKEYIVLKNPFLRPEDVNGFFKYNDCLRLDHCK